MGSFGEFLKNYMEYITELPEMKRGDEYILAAGQNNPMQKLPAELLYATLLPQALGNQARAKTKQRGSSDSSGWLLLVAA